MRICIYGAGASGGHFAVKLARAGHDVAVIARGAQLDAIRTRGLTLQAGDQILTAEVKASERPDTFGPQDVVLVTTKATALGTIASAIAPLIGSSTKVVFTQNGMTWWYPLGLPAGRPQPPHLPIFRLQEAFLQVLRPDQVIGGLIYSANEVIAPGVIKNNSPSHNRLDLGSVAGNASLEDIHRCLEQAGLLSSLLPDVRAGLWRKLLNNMSGSALGLVTASPSDAARNHAGLRTIYRRLVQEGVAVAAAHGYPLADTADPEQMLARLLPHKASLLQDYEQGRAMEVGEILLAPLAFARAAAVPTPTLDTVAAIISKLANDRGLFALAEQWPALWEDASG